MSVVSGSLGAVLGSSSAKKAAKITAAAIDRATQEGARQYNLTTESFAPYTEVGTNALDDYQKMLYGGYDMQESPAAQYQLTQGTKAMNRALASRGLSGSGSAVNRLTELNSSIAATDWSNQYNRLLDAINIGTSESAKTASAGSKYADQLYTAAGQLGNSAQNQAQSMNSIYSNAANNIQNSGLNVAALGTKSGWWGGGGNTSTGTTADGSTMVGYENFSYD